MKVKQTILLGVILFSCINNAVSAPEYNKSNNKPRLAQAVRYDKSATLPELIVLSNQLFIENTDLKAPAYVYPNVTKNPEILIQEDTTQTQFDRNNEQRAGAILAPVLDMSFDGIGQSDATGGGLPPDTNGDVGIQYYVQYINTHWAIYDKVTGTRVGNIQRGNTFWAGFGGPCQTNNAGDPIVLFDKVANVWVFSQFINANGSFGSQCFAISDRQDLMDPNVTFHRYQFNFNGIFNDYPHIGIWNDEGGKSSGYYFVTHDFQQSNFNFVGTSFSVVERDKMLTGDPAQFIRFENVRGFGAGAFGALPAHLESSVLPSRNTCAPFVGNRTDLDAYLLWLMCVDWTVPDNSFMTDAIRLNANSAFDSGVNDVPQPAPAPSGSALDTLAGNTMYRASARAFPAETGLPIEIVANHTINVGNGLAGIRWVDLSLAFDGQFDLIFKDGLDGDAPQTSFFESKILDEGVHSPDVDNRWMGTISIDQSGNLGLAYSVASDFTFPSVRYTGRLRNDTKGQMQLEQTCVAGGGVQTFVDSQGGPSRWGDYSSMSIDPVDQCTFWSSVEYVATTGGANWENRICSFKHPSCGDSNIVMRSDSPSHFDVCTLQNNSIDIPLDMFPISGVVLNTTLTGVNLPGGITINFDNGSFANLPGSAVATVSNLDLAGVNSFDFQLQASSPTPLIIASLPFSMSVSTGNPSTTLLSPGNLSTDVSVRPVFNWNISSDGLSYNIEISTDSNFNTIVESGSSDTNSYTPQILLEANTQYFWRITVVNNCGVGVPSTTFNFTTGVPGSCPLGLNTNIVFIDDLEGDISDWTMPADPIGSGNTWAQSGVRFNSGTSSLLAVDSDTPSDQYLVSPSIVLPQTSGAPMTLSFWNFQAIESRNGTGPLACWDGAILEISTDAGATFTQIAGSKLLTDPYNGNVTLGTLSPINGFEAWCADAVVAASGDQEVVSIVDITQYLGQTVQFRFRLGTDDAAGDEGWYIDDVTVQSCID